MLLNQSLTGLEASQSVFDNRFTDDSQALLDRLICASQAPSDYFAYTSQALFTRQTYASQSVFDRLISFSISL
jgi:hypothetical protein